MHPWHDCYLDEQSVQRSFPVVIEVPKGSKNSPKLDKERDCSASTACCSARSATPPSSGFIPRTFCDDGDPLDALVLGQDRCIR